MILSQNGRIVDLHGLVFFVPAQAFQRKSSGRLFGISKEASRHCWSPLRRIGARAFKNAKEMIGQ